MLQNEALVAKICFDTAENEPFKVCVFTKVNTTALAAHDPERLADARRHGRGLVEPELEGGVLERGIDACVGRDLCLVDSNASCVTFD